MDVQQFFPMLNNIINNSFLDDDDDDEINEFILCAHHIEEVQSQSNAYLENSAPQKTVSGITIFRFYFLF